MPVEEGMVWGRTEVPLTPLIRSRPARCANCAVTRVVRFVAAEVRRPDMPTRYSSVREK